MHAGGYPHQQGGYPPQQGGYPPPPQQGGYPPQQGGYPPQQGAYPSQGGYPPPPHQGGYPPQQGGYPPQQGGYPPQQGGYPGGGYPSQGQGQGQGQQGYYQQVQQQKLMELQAWFTSVDRDKSGSISARELMTMRWPGNKTFNLGACEALIKVFDTDRSGEISFNEFGQLYGFVLSMQQAFGAYDRDNSGRLDYNEVTQALGNLGYRFSQQTVDNVMKKFGKRTWNKGQQLDFDDWILLCSFLGAMRTTFDLMDRQRSGTISLNLEQLVSLASAF